MMCSIKVACVDAYRQVDDGDVGDCRDCDEGGALKSVIMKRFIMIIRVLACTRVRAGSASMRPSAR